MASKVMGGLSFNAELENQRTVWVGPLKFQLQIYRSIQRSVAAVADRLELEALPV